MVVGTTYRLPRPTFWDFKNPPVRSKGTFSLNEFFLVSCQMSQVISYQFMCDWSWQRPQYKCCVWAAITRCLARIEQNKKKRRKKSRHSSRSVRTVTTERLAHREQCECGDSDVVYSNKCIRRSNSISISFYRIVCQANKLRRIHCMFAQLWWLLRDA